MYAFVYFMVRMLSFDFYKNAKVRVLFFIFAFDFIIYFLAFDLVIVLTRKTLIKFIYLSARVSFIMAILQHLRQ